jgi:O-antigen/teichoic acid export membrane protein
VSRAEDLAEVAAESEVNPAFATITQGIGRNTVINTLGSIVPLAVTVVTVPPYLRLLGEERYGVLAFVTVLLSYFSVFDLGLDRATSNQIARLRESAPFRMRSVFWTAIVVNLLVGAFGGLVLFGIGDLLLGDVLRAPEVLRQEAVAALPWLGLAVPIIAVTSVTTGALEGLERFGTISVLTIGTVTALQILPLAYAYWFDVNLTHLIAVGVLCLLLGLGVGFVAAGRVVHAGKRPRFARADARALLRYGRWITLSSIVAPLLTVMDRVVIGAVSGAARVTQYTIPFTLVSRSLIVSSALGRTLFPRLSSLSEQHADVVHRRSLAGLLVVITPMTVGGLVLCGPFLELWLGGSLAMTSTPVARILLLGMWVNGLATIPYVYLQARGKPDITAKIHVAEVIPYALALWAGLSLAGIRGAAWAWVARAGADAVLLFWAARRFSGASVSFYRVERFYVDFILVLTAYSVASAGITSTATRTLLCALCVVASVLWAGMRYQLLRRWIATAPQLDRATI